MDAKEVFMEKTKENQTREQLEAKYDQYAARFRELLESGQTKGREAMEAAMATARDNLVFLGEISNEQGKLFGDYLKRDLAQTSKDMAELGEEARERLHPSRLSAGALAVTAKAFRMLGHSMLNLSDKTNESITYHAGEITSAGTLTCLKCGDKVQLKKTSLIEACTACSGTIYKKGY
jgi:isocitrate dehydrogenase